MKNDNIIVGALTVFFTGAITGIVARGEALSTFMQLYLPAVATLLAAYAGASRAFHLNQREEAGRQRRRDITAGEKALFNLIRQYNELYVFKKKFIDPAKGQPGSFFVMEPVHKMEHGDLHFDIDSLFFIFERDRNILMRLTIEEARFHEAIKCINERSNHHMSTIQPTIANAGIRHGQSLDSDTIEKIIGHYPYVILQQLTKAVIGHVEPTLESHKAAFNDLYGALSSAFPEHKFSKFTMRQDV